MGQVEGKPQENEQKIHLSLSMLGGSSHDLDTWLITMVIVSPLRIRVVPLPNGRTLWLVNGGDPNHLQVMG